VKCKALKGSRNFPQRPTAGAVEKCLVACRAEAADMAQTPGGELLAAWLDKKSANRKTACALAAGA